VNPPPHVSRRDSLDGGRSSCPRSQLRSHLRRDEDAPSVSNLRLLARQTGQLLADLRRGGDLAPRSRLQLVRWLVAYHWGMATGLSARDGLRSYSLTPRRGRPVRCFFRWHASDLHVLREVFGLRVYAPPPLDELRDVRVVVDLGSNIGLSPLYFSMVFPDARVLCVEPVPENVEVLRANAERNGLAWQITPAAVAAREGSVRLYRNGWWASSSTTREVAEAREAAQHRPESMLRLDPQQVPAVAIGHLLDQHGCETVDLMKIDIEGAEEDVFLRGELDWLARVSVIMLDLHAKYVRADAILEVLYRHGFRRYADRGQHSSVFVRTAA
jgi:FkbM family methyltransferase